MADIKKMTLAEKKALAKKLLLAKKKKEMAKQNKQETVTVGNDYGKLTYDMFVQGISPDLDEIKAFNKWVELSSKDGVYSFEASHLHAQKEIVELKRETGEVLEMINFSSYNYLGYGYDERVKQASKDAIDQYGTGAASSPVTAGTFEIHNQLEEELVKFMGYSPKEYGISLFSSGYGVNTGTISAFMKPGSYVILDETSHASLMEGAGLSGANIRLFKHNDMQDLERVLKTIEKENVRKLICCEGAYSADGDKGNIKGIVKLAKKFGAYTLIDEAHSILVGGEHGRGVSEEQGVLNDIDLFVITFSKAFCSVGGALIAKKEITRYINWYARGRMFSAAVPPAVVGAILKVLELGQQQDGIERRKRILENAKYMKTLLEKKVEVLQTESWIIPVVYGDETRTLEISDFLQRNGVDGQPMNFPAVPKGMARIRLFITSEHTKEQIEKAVKVIFKAAEKFGFLKKN